MPTQLVGGGGGGRSVVVCYLFPTLSHPAGQWGKERKKKKSSLKLNRLPKGAVSLEGQLRSFGISTVLPPRTLSTYASPAFGLEELT
jgi:hypothetical protein